MNVAEFAKQVRSLSDQEIKLVEDALRLRRVEAAREKAVPGGVRPGFEAIVQKVFTKHEELLRKLAQ
jgi:hypothetical protein